MAGKVSIDRRVPEENRIQTGAARDVQSKDTSPGYYDVSMLQAPVWEGWSIGSYFFLGGMSGGAYLMARMAEIFGGRAFDDVSKAGTTVAMLASLPCAPLLIADLGDPSRFHHMLRVFKPQSPMNLGTWVVTGYNAAAAGAVVREFLRTQHGEPKTIPSKVVDKSLAVITDAAGIPLALVMLCYTGVLLSGTATPLWVRNKWLAPLFAASAVGNGASGISLALALKRRNKWFSRESRGEKVLGRIETAAHVLETILLVRYLISLGPRAKPLLAGKHSAFTAAHIGGIIGSEILRHAPLNGRAGRWAKIIGSGLGIASGFALKYGILEAGHPSSKDPEQARLASRPQKKPMPLMQKTTAPSTAPLPTTPSGGPNPVLSL